MTPYNKLSADYKELTERYAKLEQDFSRVFDAYKELSTKYNTIVERITDAVLSKTEAEKKGVTNEISKKDKSVHSVPNGGRRGDAKVGARVPKRRKKVSTK